MSPPMLLTPSPRDLGGGLVVRRVLPHAGRAAVGPFVFFDHFGPLDVPPDANHDVRPHPHIGLATVSFLFEGALIHRDSTGAVQRIEPGDVNWMNAGRGIVHSERMPPDLRGTAHRSHGLQLWIALPAADEEAPAAFSHTPAAAMPRWTKDGVDICVLAGQFDGRSSPVPVASRTLYLALDLTAGAAFALGRPEDELAVYPVDGPIDVDGHPVAARQMAVLPPDAAGVLSSPEGGRVMVIGGQPLGHRHLWWNFVSTRRERLVQAADDWAAGRFPAVPGDAEFIPLPDRRPG